MSLERETAVFLTEKRTRKAIRRKKKLWDVHAQSLAARHRQDTSFGAKSKIITMLDSAYDGEGLADKGHLKFKIPTIFSVLESPESAIDAALKFAKSVRRQRIRSVFLDHSGITEYDLASSGLMDALAIELKMEARNRRRKIKWRGVYPKDRNIRRFIQALGIVKHLEIVHEYPDAEEAKKLRLFDERKRHYILNRNPLKADFKTKTVQGFVTHINRCLADHGKVLIPATMHELSVYTGEILDNAEQHAGMIDWTIQGYLDNSLAIPICEIAIFNFGKTIAETLAALPASSYTRQQIAPY